MRKVLIVGSHGLHGKYGGWDQLVNNLSNYNQRHQLFVVNPADNPFEGVAPDSTIIINSKISGAGIKGLFLDWFYVLRYVNKVDTFLLLGAKSIPAALVAKLMFKSKIVVNVGGIEWERPQYNAVLKKYLKICFNLSLNYADVVILDNEHYFTFCKKSQLSNVKVIPYGGEIDGSLNKKDLLVKYPFLLEDYYLSISRAIKDNHIEEICEAFKNTDLTLVLISNFSTSEHGIEVFNKYRYHPNLILIDGLYDKPELDLVRRECKAYIHTHTLCGSAPSLIEMVRAQKYVFSIDVPQNRFTLSNVGSFFTDFKDLIPLLEDTQVSFKYKHPLFEAYDWKSIIDSYLDSC